jgi:protein O-mannosyl-transferase
MLSMSLSNKEKKYIRKHYKKEPLENMANKLNVSHDSVSQYLESFLGIESYPKLNQSFVNVSNNFSIKRWLKSNWFLLLFLFLFVFTAFGNSLPNDFVSDDKITFVDRQIYLKTFNYVLENYMYLAKAFEQWFIFTLAGPNPTIFRLANIFLHMGSVFALFAIISIIINKRTAFIASSLLAVHPIIVESVTWIGGHSYVQYSFFFLLSLLFYILSVAKPKYYNYSIIFFTLSVLSSEKAFITVLIFILYEYVYGDLKRNWRRIIPFLIVSFISALFILGITQYFTNRITRLRTEYYQTENFYNPLLQIPTAISTYISLLIWPDRLSFYHTEGNMNYFEYAWRLSITIAFITAILISFKKNRFVFFCLTLFVITLLPSLTPLRIAWVVAERYAYLGSAFLITIIAYGMTEIGNKKKSYKLPMTILLIIIFLGLLTRTIIRNNDFKNQDTLWIATARTSQADPKIHNNLGDMYGRQNKYDLAVAEFKKAIELLPNYADAYHNLGNTYVILKKYPEAIDSYNQALKYNPNLWQTYQSMALIDTQQKKYSDAITAMQQAIKINGKESALYVNLGIIYIQNGQKDRAVIEFQKALELDPNNQFAKQNLLNLK